VQQLDTDTALALFFVCLACLLIWLVAHSGDDGDE
jgi:hypothetical protein